MSLIGKIFKVGVRTVGTALAVGLDAVTCGALGAIVKEVNGTNDDTPFLTEGAGRKLAQSIKELGKEVDRL
jgi:hypothetical protein